jgi:hypothetical protein
MNDVLRSRKDTTRVLLLFARSINEPGVKEQIERLEETAAAFRDRDMELIVSTDDGSQPSTALPAVSLPRAQASVQRRRFEVGDEDPTVILLGKDGRRKLSAVAPVDPERVYELIDSMPVRKAELRARRR